MITAKIEIIDDNVKFRRLMAYIEKIEPEFTVLDVETNGLSEKTSKLWGIGLCFNDEYAFYIPWRTKLGEEVWQFKDVEFITNWLYQLCKNTKLLTHNGLFDTLIIENNLGIRISDFIYSDTMLLKHLIDEEQPSGLKPTAVKYLGSWADKAQGALMENIKANGGRTTKENTDFFLADTEILGEYCGWDVLLTWKLFNLFEPMLYKQGLDKLFYVEEIMPLYHVVIDLKRKGMPIDVPHFQKLKEEISKDIDRLELEVMGEIQPHVGKFAKDLLNEEVPVSNKGSFPKSLAEILEIPLPVTKDGKITLAKKAIEAQKADSNNNEFYDWVIAGGPLPKNIDSKAVSDAQKRLFFSKHPDQKYVYNLKSNDHLSHLLCDKLGYQPLEKTPTGKNKIDDDFLESIKTSDPTVQKLLDYKKLNKLASTYIEGILERQIEGRIYTSFLIHGTTSGRWSSKNPNLQNLPRIRDSKELSIVDKYTNAIRKGFIAGKGYKIVDSDYSALEPRCFSSVTEDSGLLDLWKKGEDLYSRIAVDTFKLKGISANPKDSNYLKNINPEFRQKAKIFCLAVPYGAEASRISDEMGIDYGEAQQIINSYLTAYPGLKRYMAKSNYLAKKDGQVATKFGRIRHLKNLKILHALYGEEILDYKWAKSKGLLKERRIYKNELNSCKNFFIQGLAAHILNRAIIGIHKELKIRKLDAYISLAIHDQIVCVAREDQAEEVKQIMKDKMENTTKLNVPLIADPEIADNLAESH